MFINTLAFRDTRTPHMRTCAHRHRYISEPRYTDTVRWLYQRACGVLSVAFVSFGCISPLRIAFNQSPVEIIVESNTTFKIIIFSLKFVVIIVFIDHCENEQFCNHIRDANPGPSARETATLSTKLLR